MRARGACVAGSMRGWGACMAGETATAAGCTHPTRMHSCWRNDLHLTKTSRVNHGCVVF